MKKTGDSIPADTHRWSDESRRSVDLHRITEYRDLHYQCWHCKADAVFTAAQQQHAFEIKQAHISQRRSLCEACWNASHRIAKELAQYGERWAAAKASLRTDVAFLEAWLALLTDAATYSWRDDEAKRRMIEKLLARCRP